MPFFPRSPGKSHWLYRLLHKRSAFQILFIDNICTDRCLPPLSCPKSQASVKGIHINTSCIYKPFCYLSEKMILSKGIFSVLDCYLPLFELPPPPKCSLVENLLRIRVYITCWLHASSCASQLAFLGRNSAGFITKCIPNFFLPVYFHLHQNSILY